MGPIRPVLAHREIVNQHVVYSEAGKCVWNQRCGTVVSKCPAAGPALPPGTINRRAQVASRALDHAPSFAARERFRLFQQRGEPNPMKLRVTVEQRFDLAD